MSLHQPNFFVISGGPGSGKTTLIEHLAGHGYPHVPEVAREIIREQVRTGGTALPWEDREAYASLMLTRSIDSYLRQPGASSPVFFDRGIPDTLGYARLSGLRDTVHLERACLQYRYASIVILAPPWEQIYRTDPERKQDFAEAERTYQVLRGTYLDCGYEVLELPLLPPDARTRFVLDRLGRAS